MSTVWLGLGSNLGDRRENLKRAELSLAGIISDIAAAPCYESAPADYLDQPDFLNTVLRGRTDLAPFELLKALLALEADAGRARLPAAHTKGPRIIDIDILLYDSLVLNSPCALETSEASESSDKTGEESGLIIPHPRMERRLFVLKPLLDLDPDIIDPADGVMWARKASSLSGQRVKLYRE